ncbi:hypothetical protein [Heyndrickxia camelliae]|uniref:Uncharacterized protein n=1 Tax=Heyndrickxia camelliae TaxID=1707093 RepID=A0A2N3LL15_9BACI|nr:hypothetical protein [Heyndrickxia camelliae]PKR85321.1 hypothetical protein CWO92_09000 [Heyndrickxia camelliae]
MDFRFIELTYDGIVALEFYLFFTRTQEMEVAINEEMLRTMDRTIKVMDYIIYKENSNKHYILKRLHRFRTALEEAERDIKKVYKISAKEFFIIEESKKTIGSYCERIWAARKSDF